MKKYRIVYFYNNGETLNETVLASSAINAIKKAKAFNFLKSSMFQTGSTGTASAYELTEDGFFSNSEPDAVLECSYNCGKWHARYNA